MIANNIMKAFNYEGYKDLVNNDYQLNMNSSKVHTELTVHVSGSQYGSSEIHFYRKNSFLGGQQSLRGSAKRIGQQVLLIAEGHVYIIENGVILLDEEI